MSLYAEYIQEREGYEYAEISGQGFATYLITGEEVYIRDIYVVPSKRKQNVAATLADLIADLAEQKGCRYMTGTVNPSLNGADSSMRVLLAYGMKPLSLRGDGLIWFMKRIGE